MAMVGGARVREQSVRHKGQELLVQCIETIPSTNTNMFAKNNNICLIGKLQRGQVQGGRDKVQRARGTNSMCNRKKQCPHRKQLVDYNKSSFLIQNSRRQRARCKGHCARCPLLLALCTLPLAPFNFRIRKNLLF